MHTRPVAATVVVGRHARAAARSSSIDVSAGRPALTVRANRVRVVVAVVKTSGAVDSLAPRRTRRGLPRARAF